MSLPICACGTEIPKERVEAILELTGTMPIECLNCASKKKKPIGFMVFGGEKGSRKVGAELLVLDSTSPNFKENLRLAERAHRRSR